MEHKMLYKDASQPVEVRVEDLLSRMTLEERQHSYVEIWQHPLLKTVN